MQEGEGVVGEQGVGAAGEGEMVGDVAGGLGQVHAGQGVAQGDALVEGGEGAELDAAAEGGLAHEQARERRV